ncbi:DUF4167 domain-containing protein [Primorskyibacter sp. S187A]|uniref:DUF4167 domain-containing protein n=1 Tax=Primorskyibacter sp. S187A TaxID=3415130 RepID=UPI003C7C9214
MRSSKSRSRNKNNRNKPQGNVVNRVFDSSGPEGKVRGTPQQIFDKYNQLARDAQLAGDRVATENFQQHAEHYLRLLAEAQREQEARREEQERQNRERQAQRDRERQERQERQERESNAAPAAADPMVQDPGEAPQPDVLETAQADTGLVETPEESAETAAPEEPKPKPKPKRRPRKPKAETPSPDAPPADTPPEAAE